MNKRSPPPSPHLLTRTHARRATRSHTPAYHVLVCVLPTARSHTTVSCFGVRPANPANYGDRQKEPSPATSGRSQRMEPSPATGGRSPQPYPRACLAHAVQFQNVPELAMTYQAICAMRGKYLPIGPTSRLKTSFSAVYASQRGTPIGTCYAMPSRPRRAVPCLGVLRQLPAAWLQLNAQGVC